MRELHGHKVNGANETLKIEVVDQPGAGGANHRYDITGFDTESNPSSARDDGYKSSFSRCIILFQNGPIKEAGVNGITQEVLLEIVADRLRSFQAGPYSSKENAVALTHVETAQLWLQKRTQDRLRRGVEGTSVK